MGKFEKYVEGEMERVALPINWYITQFAQNDGVGTILCIFD